jgi:hypothetical protein
VEFFVYKIVLSSSDGWRSKTKEFSAKKAAVCFFKSQASNPDFANKGLVMDFFRRDVLLCRHVFDAPVGHPDNWLGREHQINFPKPGRPVLSVRRYRHSVSLTEKEAAQLKALGGGSLSLGVQLALAMVGDPVVL